MGWWNKIVKDQKERTDDSYSAEHSRTAEIKARITALRSSIEGAEKSHQTPQVQPKPLVVPEEPAQDEHRQDDSRIQRNKELNDMKAKLLGGKK